MITVDSTIVAALNLVLPTHYELFIDNTAALPCISYQQTMNNTENQGNTLGYTRIGYRIKLWTNTLADNATYLPQIDDKMASLGFVRNGYAELTANNMKCAVLSYEGLALEKFTTNRF